MSPADLARELIASTPDWAVQAGAKEGIPVGLTYAYLIPADKDDFDQNARERANARAMEAILEGAREDSEWTTVGSVIVVRVFDEDGEITPEGEAAAEAMAALADYPILDEELDYEVRQLGFEADWDNDVKYDIERGFLDVGWSPRVQIEIVDELPDGWEDKVFDQYRQRETETKYDDRGYHTVDRELVGEILRDLGWVVDGDDEE